MNFRTEYSSIAKKREGWMLRLLPLIGVWVFVFLFSIGLGAVQLSVKDIIAMIVHRIPFLRDALSVLRWPATYEVILFQIRLPRVLLATLVGAALALSGATLQGLFRNPMACPFVLGISSGAALGAVCAMVWGSGLNFLNLPVSLGFLGIRAVPILAFAGALGTSVLVYSLARVKGSVPLATLLLAGIALSSILSAVVSMILVFSEKSVSNVVFWLMGGLSRSDWSGIGLILPYFLIGVIANVVYARDLNAMLLGEETSKHLGIEVERVKRHLLCATSLLTAAAVSVSGIIGFVGLIVPHIVRLIIGPDHRLLVPMAALAGAIFLTTADTLARTVIQPAEIPVGAITALFGGPFFIFLLRRRRVTLI